MGLESQIGGDGKLFVGEDKTLILYPLLDLAGVPVDMAGKTLSLVIAKTDTATPFLIKSPAAITGAYNVDPVLNTQKASVELTDTELDLVRKAVTWRYRWKWMDHPETVLAYGDIVFEKAPNDA